MSQHRPPKGPGPYLVGQRPRGIRLNTQPRAYAARANLSKSRMSAAAISLTPAKAAAALSICAYLILIQRRGVDLPVTCYAKCLGSLDPTGQCLKGGECHLAHTRSGVQYNFLCNTCGTRTCCSQCVTVTAREGVSAISALLTRRRPNSQSTANMQSGTGPPPRQVYMMPTSASFPVC